MLFHRKYSQINLDKLFPRSTIEIVLGQGVTC
jgi:hypothetical protein